MEYSEYEKYKGITTNLANEPKCSCRYCGTEVENENYLATVNHKKYGRIKICGICKGYLKRTKQLIS